MTPLDPSDELSRRLFEAARSEPLPPGGEQRVMDAVRRTRDERRRAAPGRAVGYVLLAAALLSGVVLLARRREPEVAITGEPMAKKRLEAPAPLPIVPERATAAVPPSPVEPPASARAPRAAPPATLADELAVLKEAESALAASDPRTALAALDRYDHVLKGKQMRAEATLLRLEALSRAGNRRLAATLAARFVAQNPGSPLVDRARSFLSSSAAATDGGRP
jgi:hypothetical protein